MEIEVSGYILEKFFNKLTFQTPSQAMMMNLSWSVKAHRVTSGVALTPICLKRPSPMDLETRNGRKRKKEIEGNKEEEREIEKYTCLSIFCVSILH